MAVPWIPLCHPLLPTYMWKKWKRKHSAASRGWHQPTDSSMWMTCGLKSKSRKYRPSLDHINTIDSNIKFSREDTKDKRLAFLDYNVLIRICGNLEIEIYRKSTHIEQCLLFDFHHSLQHKLGVIGTLHHKTENFPAPREGKHALGNSSCGYTNWAIIKSVSQSNKAMADRAEI